MIDEILCAWERLNPEDQERERAKLLDVIADGRPVILNLGVPESHSAVFYRASNKPCTALVDGASQVMQFRPEHGKLIMRGCWNISLFPEVANSRWA